MKKKLTLLFLGSMNAGPVYSLEMAKAISEMNRFDMQIILSSRCSNLSVWIDAFKNTSIKIVIVDTYNHSFGGVVKSFFQKAKTNRVIEQILLFNTDILYVPFDFLWAPLIYPKLKGKVRLVVTIHDPHPHPYNSLKNVFHVLLAKINMFAYKLADDVIILNQKDFNYVQNNICSRVVVIPHAAMNYYVKGIPFNSTIHKTIAYVGRIEPYKGIDLLIEAYKKVKVKDLRLIIAGKGKLNNDLIEYISENKNIELINRYINDDEFQPLMDRIDFLVLPYKSATQSGVIPLAFAFSTPVIATNVGALSEQIPTGTGRLVEPNSDSIAESIDWMYDNEIEINSMGYNAYNYASKYLTWEHSAEILLSYLEG